MMFRYYEVPMFVISKQLIEDDVKFRLNFEDGKIIVCILGLCVTQSYRDFEIVRSYEFLCNEKIIIRLAKHVYGYEIICQTNYFLRLFFVYYTL